MQQRSKSIKRGAALVAAVAGLVTVGQVSASTWTTAANGNWGDGTKWSGGVPNAASAIADFSTLDVPATGYTVTIDSVSGYTVGQILATDTVTATKGNITLSTNSLTLDNGASQPVINVNNISDNYGGLWLNADVKGTNGFNKTGNATLMLRYSDRSYTGVTKISAGRVVIDRNASLGDKTVGSSIELAGGQLSVNAGFALDNAGANARNILISNSASSIEVQNAADTLTVSGVVSGTANWGKWGNGTLKLTNANTNSGVLTINAGTILLGGGNNRLATGSGIVFGNKYAGEVLDLGGSNQTIASLSLAASATTAITSTIKNGNLTVSGTTDFAPTLYNGTVVDMTGLSSFTYNAAAKSFTTNNSTATSTANVNLSTGQNTITAANLNVGTGGAAYDAVTKLNLGASNTFNVDNVQVGGWNGTGGIAFQSSLASQSFKLRGSNGTGATASVIVGQNGNGFNKTQAMDLSGATVDMLATSFVVGQQTANANVTLTSTFSMGDGTFVADTVSLGQNKTGNTGTPTLTSTFTQNGGTATIKNLVMGENVKSGANDSTGATMFKPTYNLNGTLRAASIAPGNGNANSASVRTLNWNGGTIQNYDAGTDLVINGIPASGGTLNINLGSSGNRTFSVDAGRTITVGANAAFTGSAALVKIGDGKLVLNTPVSVPLSITAGSLGGSATGSMALNAGAGTHVAPGNSIGTLTVGSATIAGALDIEYDSAANTIDLLDASAGALDITGASLTLADLAVTPADPAGAMVFAKYQSLTGSFSSINGLKDGWSVDYNYNGTNQIAVMVPEPGTVFFGLGMASLALMARRRRA